MHHASFDRLQSSANPYVQDRAERQQKMQLQMFDR